MRHRAMRRLVDRAEYLRYSHNDLATLTAHDALMLGVYARHTYRAYCRHLTAWNIHALSARGDLTRFLRHGTACELLSRACAGVIGEATRQTREAVLARWDASDTPWDYARPREDA